MSKIHELEAEIKRLKLKLFEAEMWVMNPMYSFENDIKELNRVAEELFGGEEE